MQWKAVGVQSITQIRFLNISIMRFTISKLGNKFLLNIFIGYKFSSILFGSARIFLIQDGEFPPERGEKKGHFCFSSYHQHQHQVSVSPTPTGISHPKSNRLPVASIPI
jgi:hypothetical protein